jgi:hypothetical protein
MLIGYLRLFLFALMFMGDTILSFFGGAQNVPDVLKYVHNYLKENKMQAGVGLFFIGSMIQSQLMQSGAFEIYINGNLEHSKLESQKMPTFELIQEIFERNGIPL